MSVDPVAADAWAATAVGRSPHEVSGLGLAEQRVALPVGHRLDGAVEDEADVARQLDVALAEGADQKLVGCFAADARQGARRAFADGQVLAEDSRLEVGHCLGPMGHHGIDGGPAELLRRGERGEDVRRRLRRWARGERSKRVNPRRPHILGQHGR